MRYLTLGDLKLALDDLLNKRLLLFQSSKICSAYQPLLIKKRDELAELPSSLTTGRPLTDRLLDADDLYDGCGTTIWYTTEAVLRNPLSSKEMREAAQRIRDAFVPSLSEMQLPLATEAHNAKERRKFLLERKSDLEKFILPEGGSLLEMATKMIEQGELIGTLLSDRATIEADTKSREQARTLRPVILGLISRCRRSLADEIEGHPALSRTLDGEIFGYFDELHRLRESAAEARAATDLRGKIFEHLKERNIPIPEELVKKIASTTSLPILSRWLTLSKTVASAEELFQES